MTNPLLTAAQEWAMEGMACEGYRCRHGVMDTHGVFTKEEIEEIVAATWNEAEQAEKDAWMNGIRCINCGREKGPGGLSDMCAKCFEDA